MIDFLKYKWIYFSISTFFILCGLFSIFTFGYKFSIDFSGGTVIEYKADKNIPNIIVRKEVMKEVDEPALRQNLEKEKGVKLTLLRFETVGPTLGKETMNKTIVASLFAIAGILIYLSFAFSKFTFGAAAVLAMLHDFLIVVGAYSILGKLYGAEVDTLFVTAILTTMSFSVHDTIVVFDKIREYKRTENADFSILTNKALTETIVRSLNNSLAIIIMLFALVLLGGDSIRFFAATLLIGMITGTYSSPFIATPILEFFEKRKK